MILMRNIIREGNKTLRKVSLPVSLPVSKADERTLLDMLGYLVNSQNEEIAEKYKLRPGVGLAAPQINISKRMLVIFLQGPEPTILPLVNPTIISHSDELIYLPDGEGCLSVDRETTGVTPRYSEIVVKALCFNIANGQFEEQTLTLTGFLSIVFQHEYDHLDGILFVDKMYDELPNAKPLKEKNDDAIE